jgi:hypothetical protein
MDAVMQFMKRINLLIGGAHRRNHQNGSRLAYPLDKPLTMEIGAQSD